jgi:hypothetical protein
VLGLGEMTTSAALIAKPAASQTRNFTATVLRCLNTLDPSALIGCRIAWLGSPRQMPDAKTTR